MAREVIIEPYNENWITKFEIEKQMLAGVFGPDALDIQHFGSTSIPGLAAKPVIDILVTVRKIEEVDALNDSMRTIGYTPFGEYGIPGRRYFQKTLPDNPDVHTHHVHVYQSGNPKIEDELLFRDYLRKNATARRAYQDLKYRLAQQFRLSPSDYCDGKEELIQRLNLEAKKAIPSHR